MKLLPVGQWVFDKSRVRNNSCSSAWKIICVHLCNLWELNLSVGANSSVGEELSLAALYAERAGDGGEDGDDEVDDGFDVFFFHTIWDDW